MKSISGSFVFNKQFLPGGHCGSGGSRSSTNIRKKLEIEKTERAGT